MLKQNRQEDLKDRMQFKPFEDAVILTYNETFEMLC